MRYSILVYQIWYRVCGIAYMDMVYRHKDPTNHTFWNPPCLGPENPHVGSLYACTLSWGASEGQHSALCFRAGQLPQKQQKKGVELMYIHICTYIHLFIYLFISLIMLMLISMFMFKHRFIFSCVFIDCLYLMIS